MSQLKTKENKCAQVKKTKKTHCNGSWPTSKSKNITEIVSTHNYITINSEQSYGLKNIHFLLLLCNIKSTMWLWLLFFYFSGIWIPFKDFKDDYRWHSVASIVYVFIYLSLLENVVLKCGPTLAGTNTKGSFQVLWKVLKKKCMFLTFLNILQWHHLIWLTFSQHW